MHERLGSVPLHCADLTAKRKDRTNDYIQIIRIRIWQPYDTEDGGRVSPSSGWGLLNIFHPWVLFSRFWCTSLIMLPFMDMMMRIEVIYNRFYCFSFPCCILILLFPATGFP